MLHYTPCPTSRHLQRHLRCGESHSVLHVFFVFFFFCKITFRFYFWMDISSLFKFYSRIFLFWIFLYKLVWHKFCPHRVEFVVIRRAYSSEEPNNKLLLWIENFLRGHFQRIGTKLNFDEKKQLLFCIIEE